MKRYWAMLTIVLLTLAGCGPGTSTAEESGKQAAIEAAVIRYDTILADCYRSLNMGPLNEAATKGRVGKAYYHMAAVGEAGLKMDAKLKKIDFGAVSESGADKAEIPAEEAWDYVYWDVKTGKRLFDNSVSYSLLYELVKKSDRWLVSEITVKESKEEKDSRFIFHRPPGSRPGEIGK